MWKLQLLYQTVPVIDDTTIMMFRKWQKFQWNALLEQTVLCLLSEKTVNEWTRQLETFLDFPEHVCW